MKRLARFEVNRWVGLGLLVAALGCGNSEGGSDKDTQSPPVNGVAGSGVNGTAGAGVLPPGTGNPNTPPTTMTPTGAAGSSAPDVMMTPDVQGNLPCGVSSALKTNCQTCHAATPIGGAPMPLVTFADLHRPAKTQPTMKVYQLVQKRIHDMNAPMPPTSAPALPAADLATLDTWLQAGALTSNETTCTEDPGTVKPDDMGKPANPRVDGSKEPLVALPGETCYEFKVHQSTSSVDATKYDVVDGEHYEQFYYKVPWPADTVATAYGTRMDNAQVLHHWLLFATDEAEVEGFHKTAPLPTLLGTNPVLLAGWAVGGPNLVAPEGVGFELPNPGKQINVQWHFYNNTGSTQSDASTVQICTVPKAMREHIGGITWLGTEDIGGNVWTGGPGMPAGQESTFTSNCTPGRKGLGASDSIHIIGFEPHMHRIGKNMQTSVIHTDGKMETIFDKPFSFGNETHYYAEYELKPGEKLQTKCTFNNTNDYGVAFGESSDSEMCYQFVFSWPAHALSNGAFSLLGVPDTCWE